ncbi:MAG: hypothetical protein LBC73_04830 [Oscillospiraceae bacterium]|jgi:hypothetical protein|nr:hypothetical protein [Oscillospiraceae bacterium]
MKLKMMKKYSTLLLLIIICFYIFIATATSPPQYKFQIQLYNDTDVRIVRFVRLRGIDFKDWESNELSRTLEAREITDIDFPVFGRLFSTSKPTTITDNITITDSNYNSWDFLDFTYTDGSVLVFFFDENGIAQLEHIYTENDNTNEDMQRRLTIIGGVVS